MDTDHSRAIMRTIRTLIPVVGLALGLAVTVDAQSGGAAATPTGYAKATKPLILDLSKFQKEKFVTWDKISGTVTDPEGKPAPQVRVSLFPSFVPTEKHTYS